MAGCFRVWYTERERGRKRGREREHALPRACWRTWGMVTRLRPLPAFAYAHSLLPAPFLRWRSTPPPSLPVLLAPSPLPSPPPAPPSFPPVAPPPLRTPPPAHPLLLSTFLLLSADEGIATLAIFWKYFVILAWGVGVAPLLRDCVLGVRGGGETKVATT